MRPYAHIDSPHNDDACPASCESAVTDLWNPLSISSEHRYLKTKVQAMASSFEKVYLGGKADAKAAAATPRSPSSSSPAPTPLPSPPPPPLRSSICRAALLFTVQSKQFGILQYEEVDEKWDEVDSGDDGDDGEW